MKVHFTWKQYEQAILDIVSQIESRHIEYDFVVALSRGGLAPGLMFGHALEIAKVYSLGLCSYDDQTNDQGRIDFYQDLPKNVLAKLSSEKFLVVDDVFDSGKTLKFVQKYFAENGIGSENYDFATPYYKTDQKSPKSGQNVFDSSSKYFFSQQVDPNAWIVFPYDYDD